ncbi:hypothetical protein [Moorena bouillonii]|nr:hypothetical protein [Moorena bouillonii]
MSYTGFFPSFLLPTPYSLLPTPYSLLPAPFAVIIIYPYIAE